jgi:hypothetical protein
MGCPQGEISRSAYTRKTSSGKKIRVKEKCIKAQSQSGKKRSTRDKKIMAREKREHTISRQKFGTPKCKKGEIIKEGYHQKSYRRKTTGKRKGSTVHGVWVAPTCVKAKGRAKSTGSKGKKLFRLESGTLGKYGYTNVKKLSRPKRHSALKSALTDMNPLSVFRKVNALAILNKNQDPQMARIAEDDKKWIQRTSEYKNRKSSKNKT